MRNITVVGVGYVGLVTGTCFADLGNRIVCLDVQEERIANLKKGILPIYEPGLEEMVARNVKAGRLSFTTSYAEGVKDAEFVFICVGTPSDVDGEADLQYVRAAAESVADVMDHSLVIVNKSTVPVGTGDWVADIVKARQKTPVPFSVVSCPEFLREGSALTDFMNPDRIVLGSLDREAAESVAHLHLPLRTTLVVTDLRTAEMIKYASNAFLATKVSFINEISNICEALGADVKEVATGMGFDKRIGRHFLDAGLGWGGSCFPKDVKALAHMAHEKGRHPQLLRAVMDINTDQRRDVIAKLKGVVGDLHGQTIALLGLAFKPNTDDMRDAPSVDIAHMLLSKGARVKGYDPVAMSVAARVLPPSVELASDAYECARDADAVIIVTEWNEFKQLDLAQLKQVMKQPVVIDARNIYEPAQIKAMGFTYRCFGRGYDGQG